MSKIIKQIQRGMGRAIHENNLITKGDRILVSVSGGLDSMALLYLMRERQIHIEPEFELIAGHIDLGFEKGKSHLDPIEKFINNLEIPFHITHTQIAKMAFAENAAKSPCFICAHHRRHAVYKLASSLGCNKIATGHHKDDIIETLLMNICYSRKIEAIRPVQEIFSGKMHLIRPFALLDESLIKRYAQILHLPVMPKKCPKDGSSRRTKIKNLIKSVQQGEKHANIRENIFQSIRNVNLEP